MNRITSIHKELPVPIVKGKSNGLTVLMICCVQYVLCRGVMTVQRLTVCFECQYEPVFFQKGILDLNFNCTDPFQASNDTV